MNPDSSRDVDFESRHRAHNSGDGRQACGSQNENMTADADPDWFLQAWAEKLGKKQADLVTELGWHKNQAHRIWHGRQPYRRDIVNQVARWLAIQPFELLMPPEDAEAMRLMRASLEAIANKTAPAAASNSVPHPRPRRNGTSG